MPRGLAEGLVLGYEKGAFTGADHRHVGAFESAHGGTIFLDEIGEMSPALQPKLLRVLESREVARLGDNRPRRVDVRVVAATNRDLRRMVNDGSFRADLYYRLAEAHVTVPPLRERLGDVRMLVDHFALRASVRSGRRPRTFSAPALARLERHGWPGNVRELRNLIERLAALAPEDEVDEDVVARELRVEKVHRSIPVYPEAPYKEARAEALKRFDSIYLTELHELSGGNLSKAARQAGLARHYLRWLFRKAGVQYRD
jgi:transcriptional regulator with GAF, ATPase, and Fis domain